jgi:hypothetical protein
LRERRGPFGSLASWRSCLSLGPTKDGVRVLLVGLGEDVYELELPYLSLQRLREPIMPARKRSSTAYTTGIRGVIPAFAKHWQACSTQIVDFR